MTVLEQREIKTDVGLHRLLPGQNHIGQTAGHHPRNDLTVGNVPGDTQEALAGVIRNQVVAGNPVARPDFQIADEADRFHERLVGQAVSRRKVICSGRNGSGGQKRHVVGRKIRGSGLQNLIGICLNGGRRPARNGAWDLL